MFKKSKNPINKHDADLKSKVDLENLPKHVAIIMDGNGRWAKLKNLPRSFGHRQGVKTLKDIVEAAREIGVKTLTLYAFSTENWSRPRAEVQALMRLLEIYLKNELLNMMKNNIRLKTIGDTSKLPEAAKKILNNVISKTASNSEMELVLALNYGGRQEILRAVNSIAACGKKEVTESEFAAHLYTANMPDPDVLIRTSGENRISNFLLWQSAYTEFVVTEVLWPDFKRYDFYKAILEFQSRERRYGGAG